MSKRVLARCRGWSDGGRAESGGGIEVNVRGVCACKQHAKCAASEKCEMLFKSGGSWGANKTLAALMREAGRTMPRSWKDGLTWRNSRLRTWKAKGEAMVGFERECFERCRPVVVEVRRR
jgi:hypothetical protein